MITVTVIREKGEIVSVEASGHSGYAEAGKDIVCAGVSALIQALATGVSDVAHIESASLSVDPESTTMKIGWPRSHSKEIRILTETIVFSLKAIAESYGVYVNFVEVQK
ncbi:MAG: ribosomal-processing cysteine protease Prp [Aminobacterium sp.]|jgi:uncharacterized protein YsxB (DUF464 family)|uniref:Ribosomal-processing cysteine protease Prp n=1 Tax=bioreactor metagenome TaxID=1076179 RepID=A0A645EI31_9ZZZZ|nr:MULTISPECIES: ribosomal-processing cysteine protease Prp [unclassified Aminobacterium]MDD2207000.1 ribosomal-processing cysteine protease Prp [Aminobacterium sp.]MDD3425634.1 ribosomal-processing cysteine protease Prp [Aminobacterium sp.]MDD3707970.1 ribosomal-processing cysteine protease Prp [Aminobacterium sp.]MDD4228935.1 ribosomal-processing cysteine protease Prp [Aminobacterium sp.]MDD4551877.1 ribosomal-processing cysteine protease Prp [Aminobacterium sp.]